MSDNKLTTLTPEQIEAIAGGDCNLNDIITAMSDLKRSYETLIDFTSYVIERVAGP